MGTVRYRLHLDNKAATQEQLDDVEEIRVSQAIDIAWEARLTMNVCTSDLGVWSGPNDTFTSPFSRIRVEIDPGDGKWVALIDGPVVGGNHALNAEPGQSSVTAIVQDDSVYLNRVETVHLYLKKLDHEIATSIFSDADHIDSSDIEKDTKPPDDLFGWVVVEFSTEMQLLRKLAKRQGKHAYVLPGKKPGKSVGVFRKFPTKTDGLPPLILLGADRNMESFDIREDSQAPANYSVQTLSLADKKITRATASFADVDVLGEEAAGKLVKEAAKRVLPPGKESTTDAKTAVTAAADASGYSIQASGAVTDSCYAAALSPYRVVTVKGVNARMSGDYLIKSVDHVLNRSTYHQSFSLMRNARSKGGAASALPKVF